MPKYKMIATRTTRCEIVIEADSPSKAQEALDDWIDYDLTEFVTDNRWDFECSVEPANLSEECAEVYEKRGQYGVYNHVQTNYPSQPWAWCEPCDHATPIDTADKACLVCGSPTVPYTGQGYYPVPKQSLESGE